MILADVAPGLAQVRSYQRAWVRGDLAAGVAVAAYLIPQVMAYATVAGLPPAAGLWASLPPLIAYALLGSSRQLSVGPESTTALMTAVVLAPMAAGGSAHYAALAAALAVLVGMLCFVAGVARLGFLANLLSRPVVVGYLAGIAIVMIGTQLGKVTGVPVAGGDFVHQIRSFGAGVHHLHWPTIVLSGSVLVLLMLAARWTPRAPGPLIVVLAATAVVAAFSLAHHGIYVVGQIPAGSPAPAVPRVRLNELTSLVVPASGIAVVAFSDTVLTGRAFAADKGEEVDANTDLRALGLCNTAAGMMQGFPVSCSASR
ncbi:MAG TPA: SulP family inorganic anion transporter, partial [Mycobacterium sp.]|nr:SulP family inorganic anion transporter [Mycobacterium sp.]